MENQPNQITNSLILKNKTYFLITLTLMSMAGLIGSDIYLPTLPTIGKVFLRAPNEMQWTLALYLLGLSIGQLFLGPLTQQYGRKKLILFGMGLYFAASMSCVLSLNFTQLLASRFFQAIGACSGLVVGRVIVGDLFETKEAGRVFATVLPFVGMSPAISPAIGGLIGHSFGWQANFIFVALFALGVWSLIKLYVPETLKKEDKKKVHLLELIATYPQIFLSRSFLFYALAPSTAYIAYFAYIAQSPFIFHARGFGEQAIGVFYITLSLTYVMGSFSAKHKLKNNDLDKVINLGFYCFMLGAILFLLGAIFKLSLPWMVAFISILTFGNGFLIPLGTAGVISSFPKNAGYASGLLGCTQLGSAALTTLFIGEISSNQLLRLAEFIFIVSVLGFMLRSTLTPKRSKLIA